MAYVPFTELDTEALTALAQDPAASVSQRRAASLELDTRLFASLFTINCAESVATLDVQNQGQATTAKMLWKALVASKKAGCLELVVTATKGPAKGKKARFDARCNLMRQVGECVTKTTKGKVSINDIVPDSRADHMISVFLNP